MTVHIHHDKETYSEVDLTKTGAYKYADDPSTDCLLTSGLVRQSWNVDITVQQLEEWIAGK